MVTSVIVFIFRIVFCRLQSSAIAASLHRPYAINLYVKDIPIFFEVSFHRMPSIEPIWSRRLPFALRRRSGATDRNCVAHFNPALTAPERGSDTGKQKVEGSDFLLEYHFKQRGGPKNFLPRNSSRLAGQIPRSCQGCRDGTGFTCPPHAAGPARDVRTFTLYCHQSCSFVIPGQRPCNPSQAIRSPSPLTAAAMCSLTLRFTTPSPKLT